ncbi:MAG: Asp-tRNA(Asn)/Glu-tRNA(Gln) amidotransferase subunit GatA [Pseudomonadales bacterium]|nr:Asp-tRNA(Asn)/Glu-tRNA(Gln) amidotransferase subunit GatA [Pseudomonadales bacterium]MCP5185401.1 Asp-tRNA(Asn)/Glu-tRNA(Gln) amidotransferase subunit GatA [Pseudomonadales bacterium]
MHHTPVAGLSALLTAGELSSVELTRHFLDRIERYQGELNAFITVTPERALADAAAADARRRQGDASPLTGIPYACKDIFCTRDVLTTCGSKMLANFVAPYESTATARIADAGAVLLGKTNMDEFAMGSSNESSFFGSVGNPWNIDCVPGGSSGGSAVAVAAGLAPLATGTDTGGSIRQPAAFCGISGLKPTYGRVSRYGMIAFASSLDQGGPMARGVEDLGLLLGVMAGFDAADSTSSDANEDWLAGLREGRMPAAEPLTIGLPKEYFDGLGAAAASLDEARRVFEARGYRVREVSLPHTEPAIPVYYVLAGAEASANLSRYDGIRFGHRADNPHDVRDLYVRSRSEGFGAEVKRRILTGTYALSVGYYEAYYQKAQRVRRLIQQDFLRAFGDVDILLTPTAPGAAFRRGELTRDPVAMYQQDVYTTPVSLAGLPALSLPCGFVDGLPLGMQLIAPHFREDRLLAAGLDFQHDTDWHHRHPEGWQ